MSAAETQTVPTVRTFHDHGAVEFRITALIDSKRIDLHIVDVEGVIGEMKKQGHDSSIVESLLQSCTTAARAFEDGHKLEITPLNLTGDESEPEPKESVASTKKPIPIDLPEVARDRR
jgi:hypothetical protein